VMPNYFILKRSKSWTTLSVYSFCVKNGFA
jgi:hypothetical protein